MYNCVCFSSQKFSLHVKCNDLLHYASSKQQIEQISAHVVDEQGHKQSFADFVHHKLARMRRKFLIL
jgi:hypothetical protein